MVLVEVKGTVSTERGKEISILGEVADAPDGGFVSELGQPGVALFWVVGFHVENVEL